MQRIVGPLERGQPLADVNPLLAQVDALEVRTLVDGMLCNRPQKTPGFEPVTAETQSATEPRGRCLKLNFFLTCPFSSHRRHILRHKTRFTVTGHVYQEAVNHCAKAHRNGKSRIS